MNGHTTVSIKGAVCCQEDSYQFKIITSQEWSNSTNHMWFIFSENHQCQKLEGIFKMTHGMFHGILTSHDSSFK